MFKRVISSFFNDIYESVKSSLNTPPRVRNSLSVSSASSACSNDEATVGISLASSAVILLSTYCLVLEH